MVSLSDAEQEFVLHWGEIGKQWGVNRTEAQIHALLFLKEEPLPADEITEVLGVSRSNVSMSLKSLRSRDLAKSVRKMGERREFFTTNQDVWQTFKILASERRDKHLDPTRQLVESCLDELPEDTHSAERLQEFQDFLDVATFWFKQLEEVDSDALKKESKAALE